MVLRGCMLDVIFYEIHAIEVVYEYVNVQLGGLNASDSNEYGIKLCS